MRLLSQDRTAIDVTRVLAVAAVFATAACSSQPSYFICDGQTSRSDELTRNVRNLSAALELVPDFNRWIFQSRNHGYLKVDFDRLLFEVTSASREKIYFRYVGSAGGGQFDLINGEMSFVANDEMYWLQCRATAALARAE